MTQSIAPSWAFWVVGCGWGGYLPDSVPGRATLAPKKLAMNFEHALAFPET